MKTDLTIILNHILNRKKIKIYAVGYNSSQNMLLGSIFLVSFCKNKVYYIIQYFLFDLQENIEIWVKFYKWNSGEIVSLVGVSQMQNDNEEKWELKEWE